jgi:branched-chain amino acid aminotransferase
MAECFGKNFILNGQLQPAVLFNNALVYEGDSIYEVIRLINGTPVFFYDHMERLAASAKIQNRELFIDSASIRKSIMQLTRSDKQKEINLKIVFNYNNNSGNFLAYYVESLYPDAGKFKYGVKGILFRAERKDPEAKIIHKNLRSEISRRLIKEGCYEALLVNEKNQITEGSRSNIFFLKNNVLFTAPDYLVLNGITRKYIIQICRENNIIVKYEPVNADEFSGYNAVFMTGTSPMVLPFNQIDDKFFNVDVPLVEKLRNHYLLKVEESIRQLRSEY